MSVEVSLGRCALAGSSDMDKVSKKEKQKWLSRSLDCRREYARLQREKAERFAAALSCTASYERVVVSASADPHKFDGLAMLGDGIDERLEELKKVRAEIKKAVFTLKNEGEREVLFERYVNMRKFEDIGPRVGYSEGHVYVLHRQGIEHIRITRRMIERSQQKKKTH